MAGKEDSTGGTTPETGKAARAMTEVGGVRSREDPMPDLWWSGQNTGERRDATCSAGERRREGCGDGPQGLPAPDKVRQLQIILYRRAVARRQRNPESRAKASLTRSRRMRKNRPSGLMRGGKQRSLALPLNLSLPAYSTPEPGSTAGCGPASPVVWEP